MEKQLFTSEAVSVGHPDKLCDQISDALLDACIEQDKDSRVAVETLATTNTVVIAGEITTAAVIKPDAIAREVIRQVGYEDNGFDWRTVNVHVLLHQQSPDIALGVNASDNHQQGAGDQGMMFGYAENNPDENYMPMPIFHAHDLMRRMERIRLESKCGSQFLRPDAKCQMTFDYSDKGLIASRHLCFNISFALTVPKHYSIRFSLFDTST